MSASFKERDAIEFIASQIADEASRAGRPLSAVERKMLFFSESSRDARDFGPIVEAFHRECDEDEYERRIACLIRASRERADRNGAAAWSAAVNRLETSDRYLGVMLDLAGVRRSESVSWRDIVAILITLGAYIVFAIALRWYLGHNPARDEEAFYAWLVAAACALAYVTGRLTLGAERVDRFIDRVINRLFGARQQREP